MAEECTIVFYLWKATVAFWQFEEQNEELLEYHFFILLATCEDKELRWRALGDALKNYDSVIN